MFNFRCLNENLFFLFIGLIGRGLVEGLSVAAASVSFNTIYTELHACGFLPWSFSLVQF